MKPRKKAESLKNSNVTFSSDEEYSDVDLEDIEEDSVVDTEDEEELRQLREQSDDTDSEEEVLPVHSSESSEDEDDGIEDSDLDQEDDSLPNLKAWGKKKRAYYSSDYKTKSNGFQNEEEEEVAKLEEKEAMSIQKRLAAEMDDVDFDILSEIDETEGDSQTKQKEHIEVDLSSMSEHERMKLLRKESPELLEYIQDFKKYLLFIKEELHPLWSENKSLAGLPSSTVDFLKMFYDLLMMYCTNLQFYFLLKAQRLPVEDHPVFQKLINYKAAVTDLDTVYNQKYKLQIRAIVDGSVQVADISCKSQVKKNKKVESAKSVSKQNKTENILAMLKQAVQLTEEQKEADAAEDGKRGITYQIAKNKGLTPRRKKEMRNPRVKLRKKSRKAKIRRKGQVREVRKELKRYAGEISGINPNVSRSIKLNF